MITPLQLALGMPALSFASYLVTMGLTEDRAIRGAVLFAALIATANGLCALALSRVGAGRQSMKAFFRAIFGGMVVRMGTTLVGFAIGLKVLLLPVVPFAAALLMLTFLFTAAELAVWSRQDFAPKAHRS